MRRVAFLQIDPVLGLDAVNKTDTGFPGSRVDVKSGEAAAIHHDADSMTRSEAIASGPKVNLDFIDLIGLKKRRCKVGLAIPSALDSITNEHGVPIGIDIAEPNNEIRVYGTGRGVELGNNRPRD